MGGISRTTGTSPIPPKARVETHPKPTPAEPPKPRTQYDVCVTDMALHGSGLGAGVGTAVGAVIGSGAGAPAGPVGVVGVGIIGAGLGAMAGAGAGTVVGFAAGTLFCPSGN